MERVKAIVLITCDELTREALSFCGNEAIRTRNLDRLCETSTEFERMYTTSPWCLPARCSMATGRYPHQNGAYSNFRPCPLDAGVPNLFRLLKKEGYYTAMFGKCHFSPVPYGETRPDRTLPYESFYSYYKSLGIDELVLQDGKQVSVWFYDDYAKMLEEKGLLSIYRQAVWDRESKKVFPFPLETGLHPDLWIGRQAAEFVRQNRQDQAFLWLSFSGPHYPLDPPREYLDRVDAGKIGKRRWKDGEFLSPSRIHHTSFYGEGGIDGCGPAPGHACMNYDAEYWERFRAYYLATVSVIDDAIGEVLAEVERRYGDDALILFTADHGEMFGNHGLWGKNSCAYEDVWHIPLLVRFPGQKKKAVRGELVNTTDILPTILEAAGGATAETSGQSLYHPVRREVTFAEGEGFLAVTDGIGKYVYSRRGNVTKQEFFDLDKDAGEYDDFSGETDGYEKQLWLRQKALEHLMADALP